MDEEDFYELHIASWLRCDIGKICIPEFVVDKATKLETIYDRIEEVKFRFELKVRELEVEKWKAIATGMSFELLRRVSTWRNCDDFEFIRIVISGAIMNDEWIQRLNKLQR